jgi:hypothetical protein
MMASGFPVDELIRRTVDLNVRYYSGMSQLLATYVKELVVTFSDLATAQARGASPGPQSQSPTRVVQQPPVMVLEGESGKDVLGVFLIENHLQQNISTRVVPSSFFDAGRNEIRPSFVFDPESVSLRSGEQVLVRVSARIDETFTPGVSYQGFLNIPELSGSPVRIVLRRCPVVSEGTAPAPPSESVARSAKIEEQGRATKSSRKPTGNRT